MPNRLTETDITGVHLVEEGANGRVWMLLKSVEPPPTEDEKVDMNLEELTKAISELNDEERAELHNALGIEVPDEDSIVAKIKKAFTGDQPIIHDDEVKKALDTLTAQNEDLAKKLSDRDAKDQRNAAIEKVEKYADAGFTADDFAESFEKLASPEFDAVLAKFAAFMEQAKTAALFTEQGRGGDGTGESDARIAAAAEEIKKANPGMGDDDARAKALELKPELYEAYLRENPKQVE